MDSVPGIEINSLGGKSDTAVLLDFCCCDKQAVMTKSIVGKKECISAYIMEGTQDRNSRRIGIWRQELKQKPWRNAIC